MVIVYNVCGISGRENGYYYAHALKSILEQNVSTPHEVVVSACLITPEAKRILLRDFSNSGIHFNWIEESVPLSVSFNHTCREMDKRFPNRSDSFLYVDSGVCFHAERGNIELLHKQYTKGPDGRSYGMFSALTGNDMGFEQWGNPYHWPCPDYFNDRGVVVRQIPVGRAINLHCQLFSRALFDAYDRRILPDLFANDTSESVFSFMCAALNLSFALTFEVSVEHNHSMDGASFGWRGKRLFKSERTMDEIYKLGKSVGFGYEEILPHWQSDKSLFDSKGYALKADQLRDFIRENLFLTKKEFDYSSIKSEFQSGK